MNTTPREGLPELPEPFEFLDECHDRRTGYTAAQMRAYALAAIASQPTQGGEKYEALMRVVCDFLDSLPAHYCPPNKKYSHHVKEMKAHIAADSKPYEVRHEYR
jgi:hypothetical protein